MSVSLGPRSSEARRTLNYISLFGFIFALAMLKLLPAPDANGVHALSNRPAISPDRRPILWIDPAEPADGARVIRVFDGDTIEVQLANGETIKVRLIGIDSPEMDDKRETVLFFAHMAKRFAFYHLYDKEVRLTYDWERTDDYGRTLAYVVMEDGALFNESIIKEGFAHAFTKYPFREDMKTRFRKAEKEARRLNKGLWRKKPWPVIRAEDARSRMGSVATVEFVCREVVEQGRYLYLPSDGDFEVFVSKPPPVPAAELRSLVGRSITITGYIEEFKGRIQIAFVVPGQLRLVKK